MAYIDETYYENTYYGVDAGTDFARLAARASDDIDMATRYSIVLADLDAGQLALVKKATCAQVEFYVQNGDTYNDQAGGSESIGSYSHSGGPVKAPAVSPRSVAFLEQSGLMGRQVETLGPTYRRGDDE